MKIVSRDEWGARFSNGAGPAPLPASGGVALHHSTGPNENGVTAVRRLEAIGQSRFGAGISYTFPITPDGTIYEGHSVDRKGTHTGGHNSTVRAICFIGNYDVDLPTAAQVESAAWLLAEGVRRRWWPSTLLRGHRDFKATACPGAKAYAQIPNIVARADALLAGPVTPPPTPAPKGPRMALSEKQQDELYLWTKEIHRELTSSADTTSPKGATVLWRLRKIGDAVKAWPKGT
jgi:hypothetical protein